MEKLFWCENVDCGAVSCRECKKLVRTQTSLFWRVLFLLFN
jgi:hypothetical protein